MRSGARLVCAAMASWVAVASLWCATSEGAEPNPPSGQAMASPPPHQIEAIRGAIRDRLSVELSGDRATGDERETLIDYYASPDARLLWIDDNGLSRRAKPVIEEIKNADDYGLRSLDYDIPDAQLDPSNTEAITWLADTEIKTSVAVLNYVRDARGGRLDPRRLSKNLDVTLSLPDRLQVLQVVSTRSDPAQYLRSFHPNHPQFQALRKAFLAMRDETSKHTVIKIPDGPLLKLGVEHEHVVLLRKRLKVPATQQGDVPSKDNVYDEALAEAVKVFQASHGAVSDGIVGAGTRRLLNKQNSAAAIASTKQQILLNMERWRWLQQDLGRFYVTVNVPEFMLRVVADGKPSFKARVVVGKPATPTPVFSDEMQEIVFNPYWYVPNSIKVKEILPIVKARRTSFFGDRSWNTSVFRRYNLRVSVGGREVDPSKLDWGQINIRTVNIYQPPGPDNVLGKVKFMFPNKHDVYMHDTWSAKLFNKRVRAESHGCIRVQNPDEFAVALLSHDQGWGKKNVASAIRDSHEKHVALERKIPVYITYFTLHVNDDGSISKFGDIYGHEARMIRALFSKAVNSVGPSELNVRRTPDRGQQNGRSSNRMPDFVSSF